jgi:hypothetical protein
MQTQTQTPVDFTPLPSVADISTPHLTSKESSKLLECINGLRSGEKQYLVRLTNRKARKPDGSYKHGKKREAGVDFKADPALAPDAHEGIFYAAPTNKQGEVYLRLKDGARAPEDEDHGWTCVSLSQIRSFRVLGEFDGPLANPAQATEPEAPRLEQPQGFPGGFQGFDPRILMAQAMFAQAQAMILMGQALMAQTQSQAPTGA